jgi:hypothetical protein
MHTFIIAKKRLSLEEMRVVIGCGCKGNHNLHCPLLQFCFQLLNRVRYQVNGFLKHSRIKGTGKVGTKNYKQYI